VETDDESETENSSSWLSISSTDYDMKSVKKNSKSKKSNKLYNLLGANDVLQSSPFMDQKMQGMPPMSSMPGMHPMHGMPPMPPMSPMSPMHPVGSSHSMPLPIPGTQGMQGMQGMPPIPESMNTQPFNSDYLYQSPSFMQQEQPYHQVQKNNITVAYNQAIQGGESPRQINEKEIQKGGKNKDDFFF
jgi:hypothetical protein